MGDDDDDYDDDDDDDNDIKRIVMNGVSRVSLTTLLQSKNMHTYHVQVLQESCISFVRGIDMPLRGLDQGTGCYLWRCCTPNDAQPWTGRMPSY